MILYKNYLSKNIKFLENSNNFVWIEIDKTCIKNMQNNLILVGTYINDTTSTYYHDDIWEELSSGILKYGSDSKPILLMGDFNGRVGNLDDRYIDDTPLTQNIPTQSRILIFLLIKTATLLQILMERKLYNCASQ